MKLKNKIIGLIGTGILLNKSNLYSNSNNLKNALQIMPTNNNIIDSLNLHNLCTEGCKLVFELVQDGNTWFGLNQDNKKVTIMVN